MLVQVSRGMIDGSIVGVSLLLVAQVFFGLGKYIVHLYFFLLLCPVQLLVLRHFTSHMVFLLLVKKDDALVVKIIQLLVALIQSQRHLVLLVLVYSS